MVPITAKPPAQSSSQEATDESLLLRYRDKGDIEAFETLVHRYERPLYNYLVRLLHNTSEAEEIFQTTFLRVHEKCQLFTKGRLVRPWIYSIATHSAIDRLRKEAPHQKVSLDQDQTEEEAHSAKLLDLVPSQIPQPLAQLEAREDAEWIRSAVDSLPEYLRVTVLLAYFQGLKFREVAEILQVPLGTVKSRLHRALVMLNSAWRRNHAGERPAPIGS
jgi:RNA polymerase sigma-70 factor (ECF subfamily)